MDQNLWRSIESKRREKGKHKGKTKDKGKGWSNYLGGGAFGKGYGRGKRGRHNKGKGKGKQKGKSKSKSKSKGKDVGKKSKNKGKVDYQQCRVCGEYGRWSGECPNRMVQQVIQQNFQQHAAADQGQQQQGVHVPQGGQGQQQPRVSLQSSYPSSTTMLTVKQIFTIHMGIPALSSTSCSVKMVTSGLENGKDVVILDRGSDVSLLPPSCGQCGEDAERVEEVQLRDLRDCQGEHLKVTGYRNV